MARVTHGATHGTGVVSSQTRIGWHMIGFKLHPLVTNLKLESSLLIFPFHTNKVHLPLILVPPPDQFRHVFRRILIASMAPDAVPRPCAHTSLSATWATQDHTVLVSLYDDGQRSLAEVGNTQDHLHRVSGPLSQVLCECYPHVFCFCWIMLLRRHARVYVCALADICA